MRLKGTGRYDMNNSLFTNLGLANIDIGILFTIIVVLILILVVLVIINMCSISKLNKKYIKFMKGKNAKSLESEIMMLFEDNKLLKNSFEKNRKDINSLNKNMELAFQKLGIIKYDAFNQMGGKLSFSLALLDAKNNGFIINSVHSTDGCYSYTKKIKSGACNISLGEEEKQALDMAMETTV